MPPLHRTLATAGHVDHGKSSLVKLLTGIDPDRLPEEKARQITIDLGFAHMVLPPAAAISRLSDETVGGELSVGVIDVPGHEDFTRNMVAGVGTVDLALLTVAADDGWMPQTEEHLQILTYLGVKHAVVALTKIDLVPDRQSIWNQTQEKLAESPFAAAPIVAVSAWTGEGVSDLRLRLAEVLTTTPGPADCGKPQVHIDRAFTVRGAGTVVTGTLAGGVFRRGDDILLQPRGSRARIRGLQTHHREVASAAPGQRVALNLPEFSTGEPGPGGGGGGDNRVRRGHVVASPDSGAASRTFDVWLERSVRAPRMGPRGLQPLRHGMLVHVHHGSGFFEARVQLMTGQSLGPGAATAAQLRTENAVFLCVGDHFVVRDRNQDNTLAGGLVLEVESSRRRMRSVERLAFLSAASVSATDAQGMIEAMLARDRCLRKAGLLLRSRLAQVGVDQAIVVILQAGKAIEAGGWLVETSWWEEQRRRALDLISAHHRTRPEESGMPLSTLSSSLSTVFPELDLVSWLLSDLGRRDCVLSGSLIRLPAHRASLPPAFQAAGNQLRAALALTPYAPPPRKEVVPDGVTAKALTFLLQSGEVIEVGPELILLTTAYRKAAGMVQSFLHQHGSATVSQLRDLLDSNRRAMVPLLERMDRDRFTIRRGDLRIAGPMSAQ